MSIPKHLIDFPADYGCRINEAIPIVLLPTLSEVEKMCDDVIINGSKKAARDVLYYWSHGHAKEINTNQDVSNTIRLLEIAFIHIYQNEAKFT